MMSIIKNLKIEIDEREKSDLLTFITLLLLLFYIDDVWYLEQPIRVLCFFGLFFKRARLNIEFWVAVVSLFAASNYLHWYTIDNHMYLMLYWTITILLSRVCLELKQDGDEVLRFNGKWLLGTCMSLAVFWKLYQSNYTDGSFFDFTLLTDDRFRNFASKLGGLDLYKLGQNSYLEQNIFRLPESMFILDSTSKIDTLGTFLTWWTILIEGFIAFLFIMPEKWMNKKLMLLRHWSLILFILSTYLIAPVFGFAWLLIIMALASLPKDYSYTRFAYIITLIFTQLYRMPLGDFLTYFF
jgi:hypothetical protein